MNANDLINLLVLVATASVPFVQLVSRIGAMVVAIVVVEGPRVVVVAVVVVLEEVVPSSEPKVKLNWSLTEGQLFRNAQTYQEHVNEM